MNEYRVFSVPKKSGWRRPPGSFAGSVWSTCSSGPAISTFPTYFLKAINHAFVACRCGSDRYHAPGAHQLTFPSPEKMEKFVDEAIKFLFKASSGKQKSSTAQWEMFQPISVLLDAAARSSSERRIIVAPDFDTKMAQRAVLNTVGRIKAHPSAFGFVHGRSALDCANFHIGCREEKIQLMVNMDIKNFFGSVLEKDLVDALGAHEFSEEETKEVLDISTVRLSPKNAAKYISMYCVGAAGESGIASQARACFKRTLAISGQLIDDRVFALFLQKYIEKTITRAIAHEWMGLESLQTVCRQILNLGPGIGLGDRFLPQGAPTSPALSNIAFKRMDFRLAGYAQKHGATYSRYADDLTFTWGERMGKKAINLFIHTVGKIIKNGGFEVNTKKTRVIGGGSPMDIVGYVINSGKPTVSRRYRDDVRKEIMGLSGDGMLCGAFIKKRASIAGKIAFIETACPEKAEKLKAMLAEIEPPGLVGKRSIKVECETIE